MVFRVTELDSLGHVIPNAPFPVTVTDYDTSVVTLSGDTAVAFGVGSTNFAFHLNGILALAGLTSRDSEVVGVATLGGTPYESAISRHGAVFVTAFQGNSVTRFSPPDTTAGATLAVGYEPTSVAFDSAGAVAYVGALGGAVVDIIDVASFTLVDSIRVPEQAFTVRVSPDDQSLWVITGMNSLYQFDRATKDTIATYGISGTGPGFVFNPANDSLLYVSGAGAGWVTEINYKRKTVGRIFKPGGDTQGLAISPDGTHLYIANASLDEIEDYDLGSGTLSKTLSTGADAFDLKCSPDGSTLWVTLTHAGRVLRVNRASMTLLRTIRTMFAPSRLALTPGDTAVVADQAGRVAFVR